MKDLLERGCLIMPTPRRRGRIFTEKPLQESDWVIRSTPINGDKSIDNLFKTTLSLSNC